MMDDRQPPQKPPLPEKPLAALSAPTPAVPSANGAGRVPNGKPPRLRGVAVSVTGATVRRRVYEAYWRWPLLPVESAPLVAALFDNVERRRKLAKARDTLEKRLKDSYPKETQALVVLTAELKGREIEKDIAQKDAIILKQLDALGWTPTAMARLGIDLGRLQDRLAPDGSGTLPEDVTAFEQRIIEGLSPGGGDGGSVLPPTPSTPEDRDD